MRTQKPAFRTLALAAVLTAVFSTAATANYIARNTMQAKANRAYPGIFEVFQRATAGPSDYWCVAGEFTRYRARQNTTTKIYLVRGMGPSKVQPGRTSVIFSFVPLEGLPPIQNDGNNYSMSIKDPGFTVSAGHASALCLGSIKRFRKRGMF